MTSPNNPVVFALWIGEQIKLKSSISILAFETGLATETIKKYAWIAAWPLELQKTAKQFPDIFTARVMISGFASRQRFYSSNHWEKLRQEMARLIQKGAGHLPRKAINYPKNRAGGSLTTQRQRSLESKDMSHPSSLSKPDPNGLLKELWAQEKIRQRLATWVEVGNGEVRIKYHSSEDLLRILEIIQGPLDDLCL